MTTQVETNLYDALRERGLIAQSTLDESAMRTLLDPEANGVGPVPTYIGFDPTADSLHVGSLVPIMALAWLQRCGHKPIVLVGGGTGLVGDPSGKSAARNMLSLNDIAGNAEAIRGQLAGFLSFDESPQSGGTGAVMVNNADWLADLKWVDVLRDVGARLSVNRMLSMESVKGRIDSDSGISYLEFSYMIMQAYDFVHLSRTHRCRLQMGGQDQWGNIVMGIELGRKMDDAELAGLTLPLVTKSDGTKFGKSEGGNVWLSADRTSVYDFYQFWRNTQDGDVARYLKFFTFLPVEEIDAITAEGGVALNAAKERLAVEVTGMVHGADAAQRALDDSRKAFSTAADVTGDAIPHSAITPAELAELDVRDLLVKAGLAGSKGEAKKLIAGGGVRVGETKVTDIAARLGVDDATDGYLLLRAGKKRMHRFDVTEA
ncbi:MAG: tyrosine--tRNA ligase [Planctomycetota bacterium]